MTTNTSSPAPLAKLPSNQAVRAIKAYYIELCAELELDPRTGKPLRTKVAHARKAVRVPKVQAVKLSSLAKE